MLALKEGFIEYSYNGQSRFCVFRTFPEWNWLIALSVTADEVFENRTAYLKVVSLIACIIFMAVGWLTYLFSQKLVRRLEETLWCVQKVGEGNLDVHVDVDSSHDEIGVLQEGINSMIVKRKQMEEALRESESRLQGILDNTSAVIYIRDKDGKYVLTNRQYEKLLNIIQEDIREKTLYDLFPEDVANSLRADDQKVFEAGTPVQFEEVMQHTGEPHTYISVKFPVYDAAGLPYGICGISTDITERKQAEERIKNQNLLLEQAVQEKQQEMEALFERMLRQEKLATIGRMAGSIAHELRNPLGAVKQSAFFLKRLYHKRKLEASNPKVEKHLVLIENELDISERVISGLLQMTRMRPIQREQANLHAIIADATERCHLPERIQLALEVSPEPFVIWADPLQLRQVFINLLTNAAQAIERDGNITIRAKQLTKDRACRIDVEDTGVGIAPEALDNIFEPLYTTKTTGTGLGLSICKQIIEHHQGRISLQSSAGRGTTVTIVLPDRA
jgi:PAS domain S-box-containing protein